MNALHHRTVRYAAGLLLISTTPLLHAQSIDWNVNVLDQILASTQSGTTLARVGDMEIKVSRLKQWRNNLAGEPTPQFAFGGLATPWTDGIVYFQYDASISASDQQAFLDAAREWETFADVQFIQRTAQANYILVEKVAGLSGGLATVGMAGGQQTYQIGTDSWDRSTLCHELGHTLGLVHEHQRSDRDSFVTIETANIIPGQEGNFVLLTDSQNFGAYDFLSVMQYPKNAFSVSPSTLNTIVPLPDYSEYLDVLGDGDPILTPSDRAGMANKYGAGPTISSVVTNTMDSGVGTLRTALYYAFDNPGTTITFNMPVSDPGYADGVFTIQPTDNLPGLSRATIIDGSSQPGNTNPNGPEIVLNGTAAQTSSVYANGLHFVGTNCTAHALVINGFEGDGVLIEGTNTTGNTVSGCYLGINASGTAAIPNGQHSLNIESGASGNIIGGTTTTARNIVSGSAYQGLTIRDAGTTNNQVLGNYIGLNAAGTAPLANAWSGVEILDGASFNIIGGAVTGSANVISGNTYQGVLIQDAGSDGNSVQGNLIGLNPAGTGAISNGWSGIQIANGARSNLVGGTSPGMRNVISGNGNYGVAVSDSGSEGNVISGNYIGVNTTGTGAVPNTWAGAAIQSGAQFNVIGGAKPGAGNVISGNAVQGVSIYGSGTDGNQVQGNLIGLNAAGTAAVPNLDHGVFVYSGAQDTVIGGTAPTLRNFISGNAQLGILIGATGTSGTLVQGNTIGLDVTHSMTIGNGFFSAAIVGGATGNQIGGLDPGAANIMAGSPYDVVAIQDSGTSNNTVRGNSLIGTSGYRAISVYVGANNDPGIPTINSATMTTNLTVSGSLNGAANTTFALDFYSSPSPILRQAKTFLGTTNATTSGGGSVSFTLALPAVVPAGQVITAAATDPFGNTSSTANGAAVSLVSSVNDGIPDAWRAAYFGGNGMTTNAVSCAACDADNDLADNWSEFRAGTNPNLPGSVLAAENPVVAGDDVVLPFISSSGVTYRVWARDEIGTGIWTLLADQIVGTGGLIQIDDPSASVYPSGYYQLQVLP